MLGTNIHGNIGQAFGQAAHPQSGSLFGNDVQRQIDAHMQSMQAGMARAMQDRFLQPMVAKGLIKSAERIERETQAAQPLRDYTVHDWGAKVTIRDKYKQYEHQKLDFWNDLHRAGYTDAKEIVESPQFHSWLNKQHPAIFELSKSWKVEHAIQLLEKYRRWLDDPILPVEQQRRWKKYESLKSSFDKEVTQHASDALRYAFTSAGKYCTDEKITEDTNIKDWLQNQVNRRIADVDLKPREVDLNNFK